MDGLFKTKKCNSTLFNWMLTCNKIRLQTIYSMCSFWSVWYYNYISSLKWYNSGFLFKFTNIDAYKCIVLQFYRILNKIYNQHIHAPWIIFFHSCRAPLYWHMTQHIYVGATVWPLWISPSIEELNFKKESLKNLLALAFMYSMQG